MREVQTALELYNQKHNRYPERCVVAGENWSGQTGTSYECDDGTNQYIVGDTGRLFNEFLVTLPQDDVLNGSDSGYVYTVNADGSVYKFMAKNTVEADDSIDYNHPFKSCDRTYDLFSLGGGAKADLTGFGYAQSCNPAHSAGNPGNVQCDISICDRLYTGINYNSMVLANGGFSSSHWCVDGQSQFETTYAVWGGLATMDNTAFFGSDATSKMRARVYVEDQTERVICEIQ